MRSPSSATQPRSAAPSSRHPPDPPRRFDSRNTTRPPWDRTRALPSPYRARAVVPRGPRRQHDGMDAARRQRPCARACGKRWGQLAGAVEYWMAACGQPGDAWGQRVETENSIVAVTSLSDATSLWTKKIFPRRSPTTRPERIPRRFAALSAHARQGCRGGCVPPARYPGPVEPCSALAPASLLVRGPITSRCAALSTPGPPGTRAIGAERQ